MPFFDDSGVKLEEFPGPLWRVFGLFGEQIERLIAVNLAWSVQLLPAIVAFAFPDLPLAVRAVLTVCTLAALPPASAWLVSMVIDASRQEALNVALARERWQQAAWPGLRTLGPLLGLLGLLWWSAAQLTGAGLDLLAALVFLALLVVANSANYWGLLTVLHPDWLAPRVCAEALRLWWRHPVPTLLLSGMVLIAGLIGMLSVGGLFLAVPVIVVLLQTQMVARIAP